MKKNIYRILLLFTFFLLMTWLVHTLTKTTIISKGKVVQQYAWNAKIIFNDKKAIEFCKAIKNKDNSLTKKFIDSEMDVNITGKGNMTLLMWALKYENEEAFRHLLEQGADPNIQISEHFLKPFQKDIYFSSKVGEFERLPLQPGDSVVNQTVMYYPTKYLKMVLEHGGNSNLVNTSNKLTPIYELVVRSSSIATEYQINNLKLLIKEGANINYSVPERLSSILLEANAPEYILILLEAGSDYYSTDRFGSDILIKLAYDLDGPKYVRIRKWFEQHNFNIEAAQAANKLMNLPPVKERSWLPQ